MRYSTVIFALAASVAAQSSVSESAPAPSVDSAVTRCLADCDGADLVCQAKCVGVPAPNEDQANDNTACANECEQGDGSPEETVAFGECLQRCANQHYFSEGAGTPEVTGGSNNGGNSVVASTTTVAAETTGTESATSTATETETVVSGTSTRSAADETASEESASESGSASASADAAEETTDDSGAMALSVSSLSFVGLVAAFFL